MRAALLLLGLTACTESSMEASLEAAASTTEAPCALAWAEMEALGRGLERDVPGAAQLPDQRGFMEACRLLPESARACMSLSWTTEHQDECRRELGRLPPQQQTRVLRAMDGDATADPSP